MNNCENKKKDIVKNIICLIVVMLCELFFLRNVLGNNQLFGDSGDGRLCSLIAEHWWRAFTGIDKFNDLNTFYPSTIELGYTDMLFGFGIIHSIFRLFGFELYMAFKYTIIVIHALGSITMYVCLKRYFDVSYLWSLFGTMAFSFSLNYAALFNHPQLCAVSILPLLLMCVVVIYRTKEKSLKRELNIYAAIILFALLAYTSWYVAFFTGFFLLIFLLISIIDSLKNKTDAVKITVTTIKERRFNLAAYIIVLVAVFIPFVLVYVPVMMKSSGFSYGGAAFPEIIDIIGIKSNGIITGKVYNALKLYERGYGNEAEEGFSPVVIVVFLLGIYIGFLKKNKNNKCKQGVLLTTIISIIICVLMVVRLSSNGVTLWILAYYIIPGAKAIRATGRFILWLSFPVAVVSAWLGNKYLGSKYIGVLVLGILFLFNISSNGVSSNWNTDEEYAFLQSVTEPPADAAVMYVKDASGETIYWPMRQLDAVDIAYKYNLQTINGYAGAIEEEYKDISDIFGNKYEDSVRERIEKYNIDNVYSYSLRTRQWEKVEKGY